MASNLPTAKEVEQAVENVHIAIRWFNYLKKAWKGMNKKVTAVLLAASLATTACSTAKILGGLAVAGGVVKILGSGKLPEPPDGLGATPTPISLATAVPSAVPTQPQPAATAAPTATQTPVPTAVPTSTPAPVIECAAPPEPGLEAVSLAFPNKCPRGFDLLEFYDELPAPPAGPASMVWCAARAECHPNCPEQQRTSWRLAYGIARQNLIFTRVGNKILQEDPGRGFADAYGRFFPDGIHLYQHPEGATAPYSHGGYLPPLKCPEATPVPPRPQPTATSGDCSAISVIDHWVAGGGHCHSWKPMADGRIRCTLDSTVRPICDTDHLDNWNSFCGSRTHDPDYNSPLGAQLWAVQGAEDLGPSPENSAQRVIIGPAGGEVSVTVCLKRDAVTADGCHIPVRSDPCSRSTWKLPSGGE